MKKHSQKRTSPKEPKTEVKKRIAARKKARKKAEKEQFNVFFNKTVSHVIGWEKPYPKLRAKLEEMGVGEAQVAKVRERYRIVFQGGSRDRVQAVLLNHITPKERINLERLFRDIRTKDESRYPLSFTITQAELIVEKAILRYLTKGILNIYDREVPDLPH